MVGGVGTATEVEEDVNPAEARKWLTDPDALLNLQGSDILERLRTSASSLCHCQAVLGIGTAMDWLIFALFRCIRASHQFQSSVVMCIAWCMHDPIRGPQPRRCHVSKRLQLARSFKPTRGSLTRGPVLTCSFAQPLWNMTETGLPTFRM